MTRAKHLRELSHQRFKEMSLKQVGQEKNLLILNSKSEKTMGLTENYWKVELATDKNLKPGEIHRVKIESSVESNLKGQLL